MPAPEPSTPDLTNDGIPAADLPVGDMLVGHTHDQPIVLLHTTGGFRAIGGKCTHYGGPLGQGLFDGETVRCPWHHACFDAATGAAGRAPALDPVAAYQVAERDGRIYVTGPAARATRPAGSPAHRPESVLIVGAGAAGAAAAETLRREGFAGPVTVVDGEGTGPVDRPNLSKDYLAGTAPEEWVPLRPTGFYRDREIELLTDRTVAHLDPAGHRVMFTDGEERAYGALLLATGASPVRLDLPGADLPHVHYLRTLADSRAIIAGAAGAAAAVVIGAGFIGLEAAASLRARGLDVRVVAPDAVPMERALGPRLGRLIGSVHEDHGVSFQLGRTVSRIAEAEATLDDGSRLPADLVVIGAGVRPRVELAVAAGIEVDRGVVVDRFLATSAPDIWAAGDIARWPHPRFGPIRVEHWAVAQAQGQAAARNILGARLPHETIPFFWSRHYELRVNFVGHSAPGDEVRTAGRLQNGGLVVVYLNGERVRAVATIGRDGLSLEAEAAMERGDEEWLDRLASSVN